MIKRILKRVFIFIVIAFAVYMVVTNISFFRDLTRKDTLKLVIDTDAGYGLDDIFALSRLLMESNVEVTGLLSSQWHYADLQNDSTMYLSHDINYKILRLFNLTQIPRNPGATLPLLFDVKPFPRNNRAARFIADRAMGIPAGEKLSVVCLGSLTNLATALLMEPGSALKLRCYVMGPEYDVARRIWNKNEFNARNDLEALDLVLNQKDLELHIMCANMAKDMVFTRQETGPLLQDNNDVSKYLRTVLREYTVDTDSLSMGSVALVQALLHPEMISEKQVFTPPENTQRKVHVYTRIDVPRMKKNYWKAFEDYFEIK